MAPLSKQASPVYSRTSKKKPRYGASQSVDEGVAQRTDMRLQRLQKPVKGVDASDGYTGREARLVKKALAKKKAKSIRYQAGPYQRGT